MKKKSNKVYNKYLAQSKKVLLPKGDIVEDKKNLNANDKKFTKPVEEIEDPILAKETEKVVGLDDFDVPIDLEDTQSFELEDSVLIDEEIEMQFDDVITINDFDDFDVPIDLEHTYRDDDGNFNVVFNASNNIEDMERNMLASGFEPIDLEDFVLVDGKLENFSPLFEDDADLFSEFDDNILYREFNEIENEEQIDTEEELELDLDALFEAAPDTYDDVDFIQEETPIIEQPTKQNTDVRRLSVKQPVSSKKIEAKKEDDFSNLFADWNLPQNENNQLQVAENKVDIIENIEEQIDENMERKVVLITRYPTSGKNHRRQMLHELQISNVNNPVFDKVVYFANSEDEIASGAKQPKVEIVSCGRKIHYTDLFSWVNENWRPNTIYVIAREWIEFDWTIAKIHMTHLKNKFVMLSRWMPAGTKYFKDWAELKEKTLQWNSNFEHHVWITQEQIKPMVMQTANFEWDSVAASQKLAHIFHKADYLTANYSNDIIAFYNYLPEDPIENASDVRQTPNQYGNVPVEPLKLKEVF